MPRADGTGSFARTGRWHNGEGDEVCALDLDNKDEPAPQVRLDKLGRLLAIGTTTLFAALNVLEGTVLGRYQQRHRHQEFVHFLNAVEAAVPAGQLIHAIVDNYATHNHPKVLAWSKRHPRWTFHFTPTSCSRLNAAEGLSATLSRRRLRRGSFASLVDLQAAIERYLAEANLDPRPFVWTAKPDNIIEKVSRGYQASRSVH